ncbi:MAG TPA: TatA/E family twin arginine-targeting protein translocase [Thermoanaerobaculia bacterium]
MFGLGVPELILIFIVALVVFGPKKLPEIGRTLGKALGEFKKATDDLKSTVEREMRVEEIKQLTPTAASFNITQFEPVPMTPPTPEPPAETVSRTEPVTPAPAPAAQPATTEPAAVTEAVAEAHPTSHNPHA